MSEPLGPEQDRMDRWLRRALSSPAPPALTPAFDRRLLARLRPRRLTPARRWLVAAYSLIAFGGCLWTMRSQAVDWSLIVVSMLLPLAVAAALYRRRRSPEA